MPHRGFSLLVSHNQHPPHVKYKVLLVQLESIQALLCDLLNSRAPCLEIGFKACVTLDGNIIPLFVVASLCPASSVCRFITTINHRSVPPTLQLCQELRHSGSPPLEAYGSY